MTREEKSKLCICGHKRAAHFGKDHEDDCAATTQGFQFCSCKKFREYYFKSEEEIEMAKTASSKKRVSEERKPRVRAVYGFDVEKARVLRDETYSSEKRKDSKTGLMLRALITANREGYTADEIFELANKNDAKLEDVNVLPIGTLIKHGALKLTTKTKQEDQSKPAKKDKAARKPRKAEKAPAAETSTAQAAD